MVTINFHCQTQTHEHTLTHIHTTRTHMGTKGVQIESLIRFLTHYGLHSFSLADQKFSLPFVFHSVFLKLCFLANLGIAHMPMHNLC